MDPFASLRDDISSGTIDHDATPARPHAPRPPSRLASRPVRRRRPPGRGPARRHADDERSGDAHRPHRRPADGIRGEPARLRVGARAIQGGGGPGPEGAVSDAGPVAGALGAGDGEGKGGDVRRAGGGAAVLNGRPRAGAHGSAGGRRSWRRGGLRRARGSRQGCLRADRDRGAARPRRALPRIHGGGAHRATRDRRGRGRPGVHVLAAGEHAGPPQRLARLGQPASHDDDGAGRGRPRAAAAAGRHRPHPHGRARRPLRSGLYRPQRRSARSGGAPGRTRSSSSGPTWTPGTSAPAPWTTAPTPRW